MKKLAFIVIFSSYIFAGGIPVIDAAANSQLATQAAKQIEEMVNTAKRWSDTVMHYKKQIDHYTKDFLAKTGIKDVVGFVKQAKGIYDGIKDIEQSAQSMISDLQGGGSNSLSAKAESLMASFLPADFCGDVKDIGYQICKSETRGSFEDILFFNKIGEQIADESKNLNELIEQLKKSKDIKESADITAAIESKTATLQAQKIQLDLYEAQRKKRAELITMQRKAEAKKVWTNNSSLKW